LKPSPESRRLQPPICGSQACTGWRLGLKGAKVVSEALMTGPGEGRGLLSFQS
jgi:hypothetical protein